jgi:hypothetical protein
MMDFAQKAAGCSVFSKIEFRKGNNQIPMNPADICKTAITTPFGLFEYTRMPFGLRNASNTFQRMIDRVTGDLDFCFAFQDDLEVASQTEELHRRHLRQIFQRLREHGLVINAEKCVFGASTIDFLGHRVDASGVRPLPAYVEAVVDFPPPTNVKELQGFLGLLNFYRKFLPGVASTLRPFTDALRGGGKGADRIVWTPEMATAFSSSKQVLAKATYLAHPLPGAAISLTVDASSTHVGAGLHQRRPGSVVWEPLGFFSKKLDPAQTRYSAFDRELLACASGIRHFRYMLEGRKFTIFTDHKPLTFAISRVSDPWTARQSRQLSYVAEYTSDIRHIAGVNNVVADTLSRPPVLAAVLHVDPPALLRPASVPARVKVPSGSLAGALQAGPTSPSPLSQPVQWSPSSVQDVSDFASMQLISAVTAASGALVDFEALAVAQQSCPATAAL